jgi:hypothetical protein
LNTQPTAVRPCGHVLHTTPDLYILVRYQPKKGQPDYCRVSCEYVDDEKKDKGSGMSVYLSPFDACIDAVFRSSPGEQYHTIPAYEFDPREMVADNNGNLNFFLHCGWGASDERLVTRKKGSLVSLYAIDTVKVPSAGRNAIDLNIDKKDLGRYDRMRQSAGLFAHADSHGRVLALDERQRMQHVARAIDAIPGKVAVGCEINQMAMYDFDAAQWHFISLEVFDQIMDDKEA